MKIELEVSESPRELLDIQPRDTGMVPSPKASMKLKFDGELAMELTNAEWTLYPPYARMQEASDALRDAEISHRILKKLIGAKVLKYLATGGGRLDLNVSNVRLTADEDMHISRMMKR